MHRTLRLLLALLPPCAGGICVAAAPDWRADYLVAEGFSLRRDSVGYHLPTAIACVPEPGPGPKDPLYFVTELRGTVKVVTNDRTVLTFAEGFFNLVPQKELPDHLGEIGLAGICLDPEHGYVFVSYAYEDANGIYRNAIMRFDTQPKTFAVRPTGRRRIAEMLDGYLSNVAHQIGPLVIQDRLLYVGIGDAYSPPSSRDLDYPQGKVLRMTLDGQPAAGNPFKVDDDPTRVRNFVWAPGFRNPFSMAAAHGRLFVADNGLDTDRFVEVERGRDYLYNGNFDTIGTNALFVWSPAIGPVQMTYAPAVGAVADFPVQWRDRFYLALGGSPSDPPGPDSRKKAIAAIDFDFEQGRLNGPPRQILRFNGPVFQMIVGVAAGPDGLYVVPLFADSEGQFSVLRLQYAPEAAHPHVLSTPKQAIAIMDSRQCFGCHKIDGRGLGNNGPHLLRNTIVRDVLARIDTPEYAAQLRTVDALSGEPYASFRDARAAVLAAQGTEKARLWIKYRALEPRFDRQVAAMPKVGLTEEEADIIATWMVSPAAGGEIGRRLRNAFSGVDRRVLAIMFVLGGGFGGLAGIVLAYVVYRRRARIKA